jgi:ribose-phosphate pyrophosphokinase
MLSITAFLDGDGKHCLDLQPQVLVFPGGESHVLLPVDLLDGINHISSIRINALIKSADAFMQLLLLTDALRRAAPYSPIHLNMPYVPYARQDRVANPGEALSAKVFCGLINAQNYASVTITDPHSDVVPALLERVHVIDAAGMLAEVVAMPLFNGGVVLLAPDAGARKRVCKLAAALGIDKVGFADKARDTRTGSISSIRLLDDLPPGPILVVDDICDGGRTFLELAAAVRRETSQPLFLYVTHGIFSRGLADLKQHYQHIYTAYNWLQTDDPKLTVVGSFPGRST